MSADQRSELERCPIEAISPLVPLEIIEDNLDRLRWWEACMARELERIRAAIAKLEGPTASTSSP